MQPSYSWGLPTRTPGVYAIGGRDWEITWSPEQIHPYARQWLALAARVGPSGRQAPPIDLWMYTLQVRDIS